MSEFTWRVGSASSLDGPERYVVLALQTATGEAEVVVDSAVAQAMARALELEAAAVTAATTQKTETTMQDHDHRLPPGVRVSPPLPPTPAPAHNFLVPCRHCGLDIEIEHAVYESMLADTGGKAFSLEHEACAPETVPAVPPVPVRRYMIEITVHRDPSEVPQPPPAADTSVLAWFVAEDEAPSFADALPRLNDRLVPFWEKVQANLQVMDAVADGA